MSARLFSAGVPLLEPEVTPSKYKPPPPPTAEEVDAGARRELEELIEVLGRLHGQPHLITYGDVVRAIKANGWAQFEAWDE